MNPLYQFKTTITKLLLPFVILLMMLNFNTPTVKACNQGPIYLYEYHDTAGLFTFYAYFSTGVGTKKRYTWDFGDGSTGSGYNPTHTYASSGNYNVCVAVYDSLQNCSDTVCKNICYFKAPKITFTRSGQTITTTITCTGALKYFWEFGDGSTAYGCNFTHTYATKDLFNLRITRVKDTATGCLDSFYNAGADTVIDFTRCGFKSNFEFYTTSTIDTRYVYAVNHYNYSTPKKGKEYWIWGDGSSNTVISPISYYTYISHKYATSGTFTTCHILEDTATGCRDTTCKQVTIDSCNVNPNFSYTIAGRKVTFTNTSTNANTYSWTFGNNSSSSTKNPIYTYNADGTFNVCLKATNTGNGCSKTICKSIKIETCKLTPDFMYVIDTATGKVQFYNMSVKGLVSSWYFGDGYSDNTGVHRTEHTYNTNSDYQACMTVTSCDLSCSQTVCKPIKFKKPDTTCNNKKAYFTAAYSKSTSKLSLYNQSNFGNRFYWTVYKASGSTYSTQYKKDSTHFTVTDSSFVVCLTAYDTITGCIDTFCRQILRDTLPQLAVRHLNNDDQFNVYPNPASNKITIAYKGNDEEIIVKITDMNGKLIRTVNVSNGTPLELSTSGLASGVYLIKPQNQSPPFKLILQ
ncbi:MAG: PKD domain-containing protein [Bacteroidota bacterium]